MDRFDGLFLNIAKEMGGIEGLLESFFSFLYRRTDFFHEAEPNDKMGFPPGVSEKILLTTFKKFQDEHYKKNPKKSIEEYKAKLDALRAQQKTTEDKVPQAQLPNNQQLKTPAETQQAKQEPKSVPVKPKIEEHKPAEEQNKPTNNKDDQYTNIR